MLSKLYTLLTQTNECFTILLSGENHPVFQAHFPNNPLLPGFIMIEICAQVLNHNIIKIKKAKFINQALPNEKLEFAFKEKNNAFYVQIRKDQIEIASIIYEKI